MNIFFLFDLNLKIRRIFWSKKTTFFGLCLKSTKNFNFFWVEDLFLVLHLSKRWINCSFLSLPRLSDSKIWQSYVYIKWSRNLSRKNEDHYADLITFKFKTDSSLTSLNSYSDMESKATLFSGFERSFDRQTMLAASCCAWIRVGR